MVAARFRWGPGQDVRRALFFIVACLMLGQGTADIEARESSPCMDAIRRSEAKTPIPSGLLAAVALGESGRYDSGTKRLEPWPWTVNNAGDGRYFASMAEAMVHVELLRRRGERNIDVGCMQVNLMHHPDAFASLDAAFNPATNVAYGARFLVGLWQETGSWERAVERYHTADPARGQAYREKVYARWRDVDLDGGPGATSSQPMHLAALAAPSPAAPLSETAATPLRAVNGFISMAPAPGRIAVLRPRAGEGPGPPTGLRTGPMVRLPGAIRPFWQAPG